MNGEHDSSPAYPQGQNSDDWLNAADSWWSQALSVAGAGFRARLDRAAKKPRKAAEPARLTDFDRDFFALVEAKLIPAVKLGAYMVQLELEDFGCAHARVMAIAGKYGARHLSDTAFFQLDSWIDRALLAMVDEPPPEGVVTPEQLRRIMREVP